MGASADAVDALALVNTYRVASGVGCATMDPQINLAAKLHCDYYAANTGNCITNAHVEVEGCSLFVAANFIVR